MLRIMRVGRAIAWGIGVAIAASLAVTLSSSRPERSAPVLSLVNVEPAEIFDEAGQMLLVTLCVSNTEPKQDSPIYVKDNGRSFQTKVAERWISLDAAVGNLALYG